MSLCNSHLSNKTCSLFASRATWQRAACTGQFVSPFKELNCSLSHAPQFKWSYLWVNYCFHLRSYLRMHVLTEAFCAPQNFPERTTCVSQRRLKVSVALSAREPLRPFNWQDAGIAWSETPDCSSTGLHLTKITRKPVTVWRVTQMLVIQARVRARAAYCPDMPTRQFPYPTDTLRRNTKLRKQEQRWVIMI